MTEIKDERDYAIRKGKVLEKFTQEFWERHKNNTHFRNVYECLIRDVNPYEIIEQLIILNDDLYQKYKEVLPFVSPNYHLQKSTNQTP